MLVAIHSVFMGEVGLSRFCAPLCAVVYSQFYYRVNTPYRYSRLCIRMVYRCVDFDSVDQGKTPDTGSGVLHWCPQEESNITCSVWVVGNFSFLKISTTPSIPRTNTKHQAQGLVFYIGVLRRNRTSIKSLEVSCSIH